MKKIIKILTCLIPIKKWRYHVYDFLTKEGWKYLSPTSDILLNYDDSASNFGDILNEDLMRFIGCPYRKVYVKYANLTCIGSMLQEYLTRRSNKNCTTRPMHIWGAGFIADKKSECETFSRPIIFHALRGKLSKERCEKITGQNLDSIPLGDPGLLIRKIFPNIKVMPKYDVGVISHYIDKDSPYIRNIQFSKLRVKYIDITQKPTENFVRDVAECRFILSSAMHGLICADSLGIPNRHIVLGNKVSGGEYKFRDYYSVFKYFKYNPIYLEKTKIFDKDIVRFKKEYTIDQKEIDTICKNLLKTFPKPPLLDNNRINA